MKKISFGLIILMVILMLIPSAVIGGQIPVIKGNSVYRNTATTAKIIFNSSLSGDGYYVITNSETQPDYSDIITPENLKLSVVAGINEINITGMSTGAQYAHIVVVQGVYSNILTVAMPYDVYYFDNFEAYEDDTYPSFFYLRHNGGSASEQKVITINENKILNASATYGTGLDERIQINPLTSGYAILEADLTVTTLPTLYSFGGIALGCNYEDDNRDIVVQVKEGTNKFISTRHTSRIHTSEISCEANTTYRVRIVVDIENEKFDYYINNVKANNLQIGADPFEQLAWFGIYNGDGTVYYDNIKFYTQTTNPNTHEISKSSETNGTFIVDKTSAILGETITVTPTANDGYRVKSVKVNGSGEGITQSGNYYTFTMPNEDVEVLVEFEKIPHEISKASTINGSFLVKKDSIEVSSAVEGDTITVAPTADASYRVKNVTVMDYDNHEITYPYNYENNTFTMPNKQVIVSVEFELTKSITITAMINGVITSDKVLAIPGEEVTLTIEPAIGYRLKNVSIVDKFGSTVDGVEITLDENNAFIMPNYHVFIHAEFSEISTGSSSIPTYKITVEESENGDISPNTISVRKNKNKEFTITPNKGYEIEDVLVDGISVGKGSTYTFEEVTKKHTIKAIFTKIEEKPVEEIYYNDVKENDWYNEAIDYVSKNLLMNGVGNNNFAPNNNITRGMAVTVLYRLSGASETSKSTFIDVDEDEYYSESIEWANKNEIVNGVGEGRFAPNKDITREEMAKMLYEYAKLMDIDVSIKEDTNISSYDDASDINDWAMPSIEWAMRRRNRKRKIGISTCSNGNCYKSRICNSNNEARNDLRKIICIQLCL